MSYLLSSIRHNLIHIGGQESQYVFLQRFREALYSSHHASKNIGSRLGGFSALSMFSLSLFFPCLLTITCLAHWAIPSAEKTFITLIISKLASKNFLNSKLMTDVWFISYQKDDKGWCIVMPNIHSFISHVFCARTLFHCHKNG